MSIMGKSLLTNVVWWIYALWL